MVGKPHGHPFDIVTLVHNVLLEELFVKFHLVVEKGGALPDVVTQDFLPGFGLTGILASQKNAVSVDIALEMGERTVFFLHHLVGFLNKDLLVFLVHLSGPHQFENFEDLLGVFLAVFGHRRIKLFHLFHGFGRIFGKRCKTLCLNKQRHAYQDADTKKSLHHYIEKWCAKIAKSLLFCTRDVNDII